MVKSTLMGFVRKSISGEALKLSISVPSFEDAQRYTAQSGEEFVQVVINLASVMKIIDGDKEVASVNQLVD